MRYKNCGSATLTFYGIEFKPGQSHSVPGPIMNKNFIRVKDVPTVKKQTVKEFKEVKPASPKRASQSTSIKKADPAPKVTTKENK